MNLERKSGPARIAEFVLAHTPLRFWPVRIRYGFLRGARWTLWPHSAYWRGHYEPDVQAGLALIAPPLGGVAWDLGAHFGFYTLWLARAVGPAGQVCAFEPDRISFERLRRHVAMNGAANVRIYNRAVSDTTGNRSLVQSEGEGATTSHLPYEHEVTAGQKTALVQTLTLDELLASDRLVPPQVLKIDIEGHAAAALRGARKLLADNRPAMLVSVHSPEEAEGVRAEIQSLGYRPRSLDGAPIDWPASLFHTAIFTA